MFEVNHGIKNNWLASKNLLEASIYERQFYSFYFLEITMATVGYGDITPQNEEVFLATITIFVTCVVLHSAQIQQVVFQKILKKGTKHTKKICKQNMDQWRRRSFKPLLNTSLKLHKIFLQRIERNSEEVRKVNSRKAFDQIMK
ncbi:hypothetical protein ABPG72_009345 [Tetrahymena utriculariae]